MVAGPAPAYLQCILLFVQSGSRDRTQLRLIWGHRGGGVTTHGDPDHCVHLVPFYIAVRAVTNMFIRSPQNILRCLCEIGPSWDADCQRWTMSFHRLTSFPFTLCQPNRTIDHNFLGALLGAKKVN